MTEASIIQLVEKEILTLLVVGSNPTVRIVTKFLNDVKKEKKNVVEH